MSRNHDRFEWTRDDLGGAYVDKPSRRLVFDLRLSSTPRDRIRGDVRADGIHTFLGIILQDPTPEEESFIKKTLLTYGRNIPEPYLTALNAP